MLHIVFYFIFCLNLLSFSKHPVHVSMCNVEYNRDKKIFELALKIYIDDFEHIIASKYGITPNFGKPDEHTLAGDYCKKYVLEHFYLILDKRKFKTDSLKYITKKTSEDSIWLYFEYPDDSALIKSVKISASLLNDLYPDQTNLVIFSYGKFEKGYTLDYSNPVINITLE